MRKNFRADLEALTAQVAAACNLAGDAMQEATTALLTADLLRAEDVIGRVDDFKAVIAEAEEKAFLLMALQAPVASDLRAVIATMQNCADVDRMAALAIHVAKIARRRHPTHAVPIEVEPVFAEMGRLATSVSTAAGDVLLSVDPRRATHLRQQDDALDDMRSHLFEVVLAAEWGHGVAAAVDVTLLGRYYERFADHAVAIGRRVIYQVHGSRSSA
ncbi:phosphate signaling complex protein PhoU [Mycolicibacterium grossiae]|uniref:phosphate signaling complex protein PhoU n=1 Tax=Mycolicibacterium grossiae TaxID=1552759 RepID=UPI0009F6A155|nr:phosphate signaling complex protein PhoU [Mycolicibacterium grossiae]QEM43558.1 phosphate signaling complex protein PhoU [Mycolicibacterium grossiae]